MCVCVCVCVYERVDPSVCRAQTQAAAALNSEFSSAANRLHARAGFQGRRHDLSSGGADDLWPLFAALLAQAHPRYALLTSVILPVIMGVDGGKYGFLMNLLTTGLDIVMLNGARE